MRRNLLITLGAGLVALSIGSWAAAPGLYDPNVAFSATRVLESHGQRIEQQYWQQRADHHRADSELKGQRSSMIMRRDRNLLWIVSPDRGTVLELGLGDPETRSMRKDMVDLPAPERLGAVERVGSEDVHGVAADKYRVESQDGQGRPVRGHLWISREHRIMVRMDLTKDGERTVMELKNLQVGPQPDALFEPPPGLQRWSPGAPLPGVGARQPASGASQPGAASASPGMAGEIADEAAAAARQATKDEVRRAVGEGLRKLLGR